MPYITFKNEEALCHAEKGSTWSNHKYIRIENGRYIYPEDLKGTTNQKSYQAPVKKDTKPNILNREQIKSAAKKEEEKAQLDKAIESYKEGLDSSIWRYGYGTAGLLKESKSDFEFNKKYIEEHAKDLSDKDKQKYINYICEDMRDMVDAASNVYHTLVGIIDNIKNKPGYEDNKETANQAIRDLIRKAQAFMGTAYREFQTASRYLTGSDIPKEFKDLVVHGSANEDSKYAINTYVHDKQALYDLKHEYFDYND